MFTLTDTIKFTQPQEDIWSPMQTGCKLPREGAVRGKEEEKLRWSTLDDAVQSALSRHWELSGEEDGWKGT